jgi:hypothetical protein
MSAVCGTRRAIKELADGTIRVQIDIDPPFRRQFLETFPDIDMPVALAPLDLKGEPEAPKPKGGELAKLAGILCADSGFQGWLGVESEEGAAALLRSECGVDSRAELDHNAAAAAIFHQKFRKPWAAQ